MHYFFLAMFFLSFAPAGKCETVEMSSERALLIAARRSAEKLRPSQEKWELLGAISKEQVKVRDSSGALFTLEKLHEMEIEQGTPVNWTGDLLSFAAAQWKSGDPDGATATFEKVKLLLASASTKEHPVVYHDVVETQAEAGDVEGALKTLAQAEAQGDAVKYGEGMYDDIALALARRGRWKEAYAIAGKVKSISGTAGVAHIQALTGDWEEAFKNWNAPRNPSLQFWACWHWAEAEDFETALAIAKGIDDPKERSDARYRVVLGLINAGRTAEAIALSTASIDDLGMRATALFRISDIQSRSGDAASAGRTKELAMSASLASGGKGHQERLAAALAREGRAAEAYDASIKGEPGGGGLKDLAQIMVERGNLAGALLIAERMKGFRADEALSLVAGVHILRGELENALTIAEKIEGSAVVWSKNRVFREVAVEQARRGSALAGLKTLERLDPTEFNAGRAGTLGAMAFAEVSSMGFPEIPEWLNLISSPLERSYVLLGTARAFRTWRQNQER